MVKAQTLAAEYSPPYDRDYDRDDDTEDTERAVDNPICHRSARAAAQVLEGYLHTRQGLVIAQGRKIRRPMHEVRQDGTYGEDSEHEHHEAQHPQHVVVGGRCGVLCRRGFVVSLFLVFYALRHNQPNSTLKPSAALKFSAASNEVKYNHYFSCAQPSLAKALRRSRSQ